MLKTWWFWSLYNNEIRISSHSSFLYLTVFLSVLYSISAPKSGKKGPLNDYFIWYNFSVLWLWHIFFMILRDISIWMFTMNGFTCLYPTQPDRFLCKDNPLQRSALSLPFIPFVAGWICQFEQAKLGDWWQSGKQREGEPGGREGKRERKKDCDRHPFDPGCWVRAVWLVKSLC